jgi:hypothetical protein
VKQKTFGIITLRAFIAEPRSQAIWSHTFRDQLFFALAQDALHKKKVPPARGAEARELAHRRPHEL